MRNVALTNRCRLLLPLMALLMLACPALAQDPQLTREDSAWARFPIGAWRFDTIIIYRENPQTGSMEQKETSEVTSRLVAVLEDHYVLEVERKITADGQSFTIGPTPERRYFDDTTYATDVKQSGRELTVTLPGEQGEEVTAREMTTTLEDEQRKLTVTSVYAQVRNPRKAPGTPEKHSQLIRRRTELQPKADNSSTTTVEWELVSEPQPIGQPPGTDWVCSATQRQSNDDGFVTWSQTVSAFVPGGIVNSEAREHSTDGEFRQGVSTTLKKFGLEPKQDKDSASVDGESADEEEEPSAPERIREHGATAKQIASGAPGRSGRRRRMFLPKRKWRRTELRFAANNFAANNFAEPPRQESAQALAPPESFPHVVPFPSAPAEGVVPCAECGRRHNGLFAWLFAPKHRPGKRLADCQLAER